MSRCPVSERTIKSLRDFLTFSDMAAHIINGGKEAYDADQNLRLASEAVLHRLGESVARIPDDFIAAYPEVSWRQIKATRNLVAHNYDGVDHEILWNALANRMPEEANRVRAILTDLTADNH